MTNQTSSQGSGGSAQRELFHFLKFALVLLILADESCPAMVRSCLQE